MLTLLRQKRNSPRLLCVRVLLSFLTFIRSECLVAQSGRVTLFRSMENSDTLLIMTEKRRGSERRCHSGRESGSTQVERGRRCSCYRRREETHVRYEPRKRFPSICLQKLFTEISLGALTIYASNFSGFERLVVGFRRLHEFDDRNHDFECSVWKSHTCLKLFLRRKCSRTVETR